jgi:2'-5' RNA ligase
VSLGQVVPMGPPRRYTALSALLEEGRSEASVCITEWRDTLTDAAAARRDPRPAKPHVSLARPSGRAALADREAGLEWAARVDVRAVRARLDRVALYTWCVPRDERLFHIVAERRLG